MLEIKYNDRGQIVLLGRFDASQAERAEAFLMTVEESREVDLGGLQYISSLGLGVLLATQKRLMSSGHGLKLTNVRGHIREIFHFSGFEQVFEIEPTTPS
jgi:anti-sigma B factor antagonist